VRLICRTTEDVSRGAKGATFFYQSVQNRRILLNMKAVGTKRSRVKPEISSRTLGRPRGFDEHEALDAALQVFWKKGYDGTSLSDLTRAMRIERPSLYATFGNKEALFRKVLDRYTNTIASFTAVSLREPTARGVVECMLMGAADALANPASQPGCMTVQCLLSGDDESAPIRQEINERRELAETALRKRLEHAKAQGDLPTDSNPADLARYVFTVAHGIAVQAKAGATRAQLRRIAQTALRALPASRQK